MLGADKVIATRMVVEDGPATPGQIEYYEYAETKAEAVRELAASEGYDLDASYAYSDSAHRHSDARGRGSIRTPSTPTVRCAREAAARGWPVLVFSKPVRLRDRIGNVSLPPRPALALQPSPPRRRSHCWHRLVGGATS